MTEISRRAVLSGVGRSVAFGTLAAALPQWAEAQSAGESAILLSLVYPNTPNSKFDQDYYRDKHIPTLRSLYGNSIERIELCTPHVVSMPKSFAAEQSHSPSQAPSHMGPPPPSVLAAARIWIRDAKAFATKTVASQTQIEADLKNVTDVTPIVQYERVVDLRGAARSAIGVGDQVSSTWFRNQQGAKFDAQYYDDKIIPLMVKLYGAKAIRRVEFSLGSERGGTEPALKAAVHYYIGDRAAWDAAGMQAGRQLMAEKPNYTTMQTLYADMEVSAVG